MKKWEAECKNLSEREISEVQNFEQITSSEWKQYWTRDGEDVGIEAEFFADILVMQAGMKWRVKPWASCYHKKCKISWREWEMVPKIGYHSVVFND